jgi:2-polyprenyl-3-methyl-5-hydroxy-6-metoxy-1,4-benzoquinol methylase
MRYICYLMWQWRRYEIRDTFTERRLASAVRELCSQFPRPILLDYGCGYGIRASKIAEYLSPRAVDISLFDVNLQLLREAVQETGGHPWDKSLLHFDVILCFSVLEIMTNEEVGTTLRMFRSMMHPQSLLIVQHVNWHILTARTMVWFLRSLRCRSTFASASGTHAALRFPRNYDSLSVLLRHFRDADLQVLRVVRGPYLKSLYAPVPLSATSFNWFFLRAI